MSDEGAEGTTFAHPVDLNRVFTSAFRIHTSDGQKLKWTPSFGQWSLSGTAAYLGWSRGGAGAAVYGHVIRAEVQSTDSGVLSAATGQRESQKGRNYCLYEQVYYLFERDGQEEWTLGRQQSHSILLNDLDSMIAALSLRQI